MYARPAEVKDVVATLERWAAEGLRVATATVVRTERLAPRDPGAVLAVSELHAPIGLDIGSRTPEEVAVAVVAEIVATRRKAPVPA